MPIPVAVTHPGDPGRALGSRNGENTVMESAGPFARLGAVGKKPQPEPQAPRPADVKMADEVIEAPLSMPPAPPTSLPTDWDPERPVVTIKNLSFSYDKTRLQMQGVDCVLPPNSRVILVGPNGAGKSTLLRIMTGGIFMGLQHDEFDINGGVGVPNDQQNGVCYMGGDGFTGARRQAGLGGSCPYTMDIAVRDLMKSWQEEYRERRNELVHVMGINLDWRLNECSDGQRKKVKIMIKLLKPFRLAVIDEFAAELDIFSRKRLFDYFTNQCAKYGASVVYATHIFDQADEWATHVAFMQLDKTLSPVHCLRDYAPYQEILARSGTKRAMCPMYVLVHEELERQYLAYSGLFTDGQQCITDVNVTDVIMEAQRTEQAGEAHVVAAERNAKNWLEGRLVRQFAEEEDEKAKENARIAMDAIRAVVEDDARTVEEKVRHLHMMRESGAFDPIGGAPKSQFVLTEALKKLGK